MLTHFLAGELRKTLPPMVVDIVEEKLEQEYLENAAKHMLGDMSNSDQVSSGEAPDKGQNGDSWTVPPDWEPMVDNEVGRSAIEGLNKKSLVIHLRW